LVHAELSLEATEERTLAHGMGRGRVWDKDAVQELRGAAYRGDGHAVVAVLANRPLDSVLHVAADGLLAALAQGVEGAAELVYAGLDVLGARAGEGDEELAGELAAALGGATPLRRAVPVDLDELSGCLEGDPAHCGGRLSLQTGEVWPADIEGSGLDEGEWEDAEDPDSWLAVECLGSRDGYRDMVDFAATVVDVGLAGRLDIALHGRGAFGRFKDVLARQPGELERWFVFAEDRRRGRARAWLAQHGLKPVVKPVAKG
jgi:hypothetical protein